MLTKAKLSAWIYRNVYKGKCPTADTEGFIEGDYPIEPKGYIIRIGANARQVWIGAKHSDNGISWNITLSDRAFRKLIKWYLINWLFKDIAGLLSSIYIKLYNKSITLNRGRASNTKRI